MGQHADDGNRAAQGSEAESASDTSADDGRKRRSRENSHKSVARSKTGATTAVLNFMKPITAPTRSGASSVQSQRDRSAETLAAESAPRRYRSESRLPAHLEDELVRVGRKLYDARSYALVMVDGGSRLKTPLKDRKTISMLVDIAKDRGWKAIHVGGTKEYKQEIWMQASLAGLEVHGHRPTRLEKVQLVRRVAQEKEERARDSIPSEQRSFQHTDYTGTEPTANEPPREPKVPEHLRDVRGHLLQHGDAPLDHNKQNKQSHFARVLTRQGEVTLWGEDLGRAINDSLSHVKNRDLVQITTTGEVPVTSRSRYMDENGKVVRSDRVQRYVNSWRVESAEFLEARRQLAEEVRQTSDVKELAGRRPELAGTIQDIRAAELVARRNYPDERSRATFVRRVRYGIATEIERGEPMVAVREIKRSRDGAPEHDLAPMERTH